MSDTVKSLKEKVLEVLSCLPVSESRIPYTYHHDYLRNEVTRFCHKSRSEVAQETENHTEDELYALCLLGAISSFDIFFILNFPTVEARNLYVEVLAQAKEISEVLHS